MMKKNKSKTLTPTAIAHKKFLTKMGVTPKQLKARKQMRLEDSTSSFRPDTIVTVRKAYDD